MDRPTAGAYSNDAICDNNLVERGFQKQVSEQHLLQQTTSGLTQDGLQLATSRVPFEGDGK